MKKVKSTGSIDMNDLEQFTFLSPLLDFKAHISIETCFSELNETVSELEFIQSIKLNEIKYGYIAGIILIFAIALELKMKIPLIYNKIFGKELENELEDSGYESMMNIETDV